ncbi:MAG: YeeE/YedE thiosulfate transporter family protein [Bacteroidetes bacterium]|jgi:uncharacterized membrane protein YedE/YeeE|nr:YeeE/YedE thiosulfate transporter family protein [Bacteroidota bacterium]MDA0935834.1 YeeE/YedE thiosulfate transporter family protein [Bacteroidota bacterium]
MNILLYFLIGTLFGITLYMSEVSSWFRIYEMFQFNSFHMYGVIGTAVFLGATITFIIKKLKLKSILNGSTIEIADKEKGWKRYLYGGIIFGSGWAISGACPGPMFSLLGAGFFPIIVVILSATLGTFVYGLIRSKLPH